MKLFPSSFSKPFSRHFFSFLFEFPYNQKLSPPSNGLDLVIFQSLSSKENIFRILDLVSSMNPRFSATLIRKNLLQIEKLAIDSIKNEYFSGVSSPKKAQKILGFLHLCSKNKIEIDKELFLVTSQMILKNFPFMSKEVLVKVCCVYLETRDPSMEKAFALTVRHLLKDSKYSLTERIYSVLPLEAINQIKNQNPKKLKTFFKMGKDYFTRLLLTNFTSSNVPYHKIIPFSLRENAIILQKLARGKTQAIGIREENIARFFIEETSRQISEMELDEVSSQKNLKTLIRLHEASLCFLERLKFEPENDEIKENLEFISEFSMNAVLNSISRLTSMQINFFLKTILRRKCQNIKTRLAIQVLSSKIQEKAVLNYLDMSSARILVSLNGIRLPNVSAMALRLNFHEKGRILEWLELGKVTTLVRLQQMKGVKASEFTEFNAKIESEEIQTGLTNTLEYIFALERAEISRSMVLNCLGCFLAVKAYKNEALFSRLISFLGETEASQLKIETIFMVLGLFIEEGIHSDKQGENSKEFERIAVSVMRICADEHKNWPEKSFLEFYGFLEGNGLLEYRIEDEKRLYKENLRTEFHEHFNLCSINK